MPESLYIKDGQVMENQWQTVAADNQVDLPSGKLLLPLDSWLKHKDNPPENTELGLWLNGEDEADSIAPLVNSIPVIAIKFPGFMDGRGFSLARLLRERYGFTGELRAIGHVIRDQLFYLQRCGFNSFELQPGSNLEQATQSLSDFSETYQSSVDTPEPLFKRQSL